MGPSKSPSLCDTTLTQKERGYERKVSVARVLLLQVSGRGRGLQMFLNSLKMDGTLSQWGRAVESLRSRSAECLAA